MQPATIAGLAAFCARGAIESFASVVCHFPDRRLSIAWTGNACRVPLDQFFEEAVRLVVRRAR
jgi:hypothetical protein